MIDMLTLPEGDVVTCVPIHVGWLWRSRADWLRMRPEIVR